MDEAQLGRYRFFAKLGFFGVEPDSVHGALSLLRAGRAVLREPGAMLWVTPQGRMADPRERPVRLRDGTGQVVRGLGECRLLPLALEYPFREERLPYVVARFGRPVAARELPGGDTADATAFLAAELEHLQDALAEEVVQGDVAEFRTVLRGRVGVGFVYDLWRRARALLSGQRFHPGHRRESG